MLNDLLKAPGFLYQVSGKYYYLGKWICKECTDVQATDDAFMYDMCRREQEEPTTAMYFHKLRAHADFALEIPYNPVQIRTDMEAILNGLSDSQKESLEKQIANFREDLEKYLGKTF